MRSQLFPSIAVLVGTIVGAGFLGIPYVVSKSGLMIGLIYLIVLGLIMLYINLCLGEIILRTNGNHQLTGYAEKYFGKTGKFVMMLVVVFGIASALLAYSIGIGESLSNLLFQNSEFTLHFGIITISLASLITFFGMRTFKKGEIAGIFLMGALLISIIISYSPYIKTSNFSYSNSSFVFAPFGVILFAYLAISAIPELGIILKKQKHKMKKALILGSIIPIIGYILFTTVVVGFRGELVPEIATISLSPIFAILGIITMFTSFLALSIILKSVLHYDYNIPKGGSWGIISIGTLILFIFTYWFKLASFTNVLNASGIISGTLSIILILLMAKSAKKNSERKPEYSIKLNWLIIIGIIALFIIASIVSFIKI
ncbi:hypothetical protein COU60_05265 [Candidatus Pacearchaeota archaeon CG10_big_fil_rev_8_21_14_0_10_34_76]|nr:MAG: hypothetical protein COU60_05265 [Candidatus Pacearchaeota archaeon CG10_big_fil_rev_8_21_14_0_10_34_76]